ncbi:amidase [Parvularcula sp. IMCC14364]|uniref:amidase n=1 Tax=Parvularcula sp. IMCC14364 TaxID=3067902 RepID=UPI0027414AB3|nr:amidase [Parvularcula sp. IMCC14364]
MFSKALRAAFLSATLLTAACTTMDTQAENTTPTKAEMLAIGSLSDIAAAIRNGDVTSEEIVAAYLYRIENIDRNGPTLNSIIALNPDALTLTRQMDAERAAGNIRGPLHGVPVLLKDNIETKDNMPTTAGALVLKENYTGRDAPGIAGLREAGAIILGKTNLSQWANFRSTNSISGWSAIGGQVRNPHVLDRSPCGSSSGSGAATAAALAAGSVGTETNGSIICPSVMNGIVGFKPTVGLVSRTHIVPISPTQDTAGPMTRSVRDAAMMLTAMAGTDPADAATAKSDSMKTDFTAALDNASLAGKRIGVLRFAQGNVPEINALFDDALETLEAQGAVFIDIDEYDAPDGLGGNEFLVLKAEFKASLNEYLATTPDNITQRTLSDVIAFNKENADIELALFHQDILVDSDALPGLDDETYQAALASILKGTREDGIDKMLADHDVDLLIVPTARPSFLIDPVHGDNYPGGVGAGYIAAIAGYPHITVPMGTIRGLPVGLSIMGTAWDDAEVLKAGYIYEQASNKITKPAYRQTVEDVERIGEAMSPLASEK